jgi:hypothetical protein
MNGKRVCWSWCLSITLSFILTACDRTESDWLKARKANTLNTFNDFISKHPQGPHLDEAKRGIEEIEWQTAKTNDNAEAYSSYLLKYPEGLYADEGRKKLNQLEWRAALNRVIPDLYGQSRHEELLLMMDQFNAYSDKAKDYTPIQKQELISILVSTARRLDHGAGPSYSDIKPVSSVPSRSIDRQDVKSSSVKVGGSIDQGGLFKAQFIGLVVGPSGFLSDSIMLAVGSYCTNIETRSPANIAASITVYSSEQCPGHILTTELPADVLLFQNQEVVFPMGAGTVYRFYGDGGVSLKGYRFVGDHQFPLTFVLLPSSGLTYLHGKGSVYSGNECIGVFPQQ